MVVDEDVKTHLEEIPKTGPDCTRFSSPIVGEKFYNYFSYATEHTQFLIMVEQNLPVVCRTATFNLYKSPLPFCDTFFCGTIHHPA